MEIPSEAESRACRAAGGALKEIDVTKKIVDAPENIPIPDRAETLKVLRFMGDFAPMLMLRGAGDGYGTRWTLDGQQIQPAIATYLMKSGYIVDAGATEMGARKLVLTESGIQFRKEGLLWWSSLGFLGKLKSIFLG